MCRTIFLGILLLFGGVSASSQGILRLLPEIKPSRDFSVWSSLNHNSSQMYYSAGGVNTANFISNNRFSTTIGVDYASYTLQYTFRLPFNTLNNNSPLSNYFRLATGYGGKNFEVDAYISKMVGYYDMSRASSEPLLAEELDPRYRKDARNYSMGLTAFYFLNEKFRYSQEMKRAYTQSKSGYTFFASLKNKYHFSDVDVSFFSKAIDSMIPNPMNTMDRLFVFENSLTFGFTGVWTNSHWFLRGMLGFGPGIQFQFYDKSDQRRFRPFISPAVDAKLSFGYKAKGVHFSINVPLDVLLVYLPEETFYFQGNYAISFVVGFHMHDLMDSANERNARDDESL